MSRKIIVVDDEPNVRLGYRVTLETEGFTIIEANCGAKALEAFQSNVFDLAILDLRMPEMDGLTLLEEMRKLGLSTPVVMITAYGSVPDAVRALKLGAIDFLQKPMTPESLRIVVGEVFKRHVAEASITANEALPDDFASQFSEAKRLINLQLFAKAWVHLGRALELNGKSPEALNLAGVFFEMQKDYERARKLYGKAIKYGPQYDPAQQNMRRIFELFNFGSSQEPFAMGDV